MTLLVSLLVLVAAAALLLFGLAHYWAKTPHGRLKPILALILRVLRMIQPGGAGTTLGSSKMDTPDQIAKVRLQFKKTTAPLAKPAAFTGKIENRLLPGPAGDLPVRVYTPRTPVGSDAPVLLVYFHGGGFMVGDPDFTDAVTRILGMTTPAVVVSVDYRLAPEHPLPAAVDDCEFAVNWCYENAESLGARPGPVAVAGDSAGGNLAAVVAQRDLASGRRRIGLQVLIYPCVDVTRNDRGSQIAFGQGYGFSMKDLDDCMRYYLPPGTDRSQPDLSPLCAKSLAGLPPAMVITAGFDPLRDEAKAYADALAAAGVAVRYVNEPEMVHGFITMTRICREAQSTLERISAQIRVLGNEAAGQD